MGVVESAVLGTVAAAGTVAVGIVAVGIYLLVRQIRNAHRDGNVNPNPTMEEMEELLSEDERRRARAAAPGTHEGLRQRRPRAEQERDEAQEETRQARAGQQQAEAARAAAERAAANVRAAAREAERAHRQGIRPVIMPTRAEYEAAKRRLEYREGYFHFAVAGVAGSGKSSLVNAFRGLHNGADDPHVARTGVTETTERITRYLDPNEANPFVWYDIPGAGTLSVPDWQYFNDQGLYIFDAIVVLTDSRFTATDIAILQNCERFQIPSYIVRSKSLQHIQNVLNDMPRVRYEEFETRWERARSKYMAETQKNVSANLLQAGLPPQAVYMVDKEVLLEIAEGNNPEETIDEFRLVEDMLLEARNRRVDASMIPDALAVTTYLNSAASNIAGAFTT